MSLNNQLINVPMVMVHLLIQLSISMTMALQVNLIHLYGGTIRPLSANWVLFAGMGRANP